MPDEDKHVPNQSTGTEHGGSDHDGAGQAPEGKTQPKIETDQTRAEAALAGQAGEFVAEKGGAFRFVPDKPEMVIIPPDPELRLAPLYAALAKAQGAFPEIPKNRTAMIRPRSGESWSFKYSDLSDLINATRPALTENGLAVFQVPDDKCANCITTLAHASGLTLVGSYPIKHKDGERMHPGQNWAISWAFARRYGMSGILGIAAEETVEGETDKPASDDFKSADGHGILTVRGVTIPSGATKPEKAALNAKGVEEQFKRAKTEVALNGVWERNDRVINVFQDHFPDLHQNMLDVYQRTLSELREG